MREFETDRLKIRRFRMTDVDDAFSNYASDSDLAEHLDFRAHINKEETKSVTVSAIKEFDTEMPVWALENKSTKTLIGYIRITNSCLSNKRCEFIWVVGYKWRGKGLSKEALKPVLEYLFKEKGYEIIITKYYSCCKEHEETLIELGMKKDAVLRNRKIDKETGEFQNLTIYSIMRDELK